MRFKRHTNDQSRPRHPGHPMPQQATEGEEEKIGSREKKKQPEGEKQILIRSSELAAG